MTRNFAFRLCGELCKTGVNLCYDVSTGNLAMACVHSSIELIDMASSIISWNAEHNRSAIMQELLDRTLGQYEDLKKQERRKMDSVVEKEKEKSQYRLEKFKLTLEKDRDDLLKKIEQSSAVSKSTIELYLRRSELTAQIRCRLKTTIDLVSRLIDDQVAIGHADTPLVADLQETLRITVAQYTKYVNTYC